MKIILHHTKGSNGYKPQRANLRALTFIILFSLTMLFIFADRFRNNNFIRANVSSRDVFAVELAVKSTPTPMVATPTPTPSKLEEIVAYITRVFEPEGKDVVVWAIKCFYSESGLRTEAVNGSNSDGTVDRGISQVNSVHNYTPEELHTIEGNIDAAYEVYQRQGKDAWYGSACE